VDDRIGPAHQRCEIVVAQEVQRPRIWREIAGHQRRYLAGGALRRLLRGRDDRLREIIRIDRATCLVVEVEVDQLAARAHRRLDETIRRDGADLHGR
jgi:hypothetical protein